MVPLFFLTTAATAQYGYDSAYFMFPIKPGERNQLVGTMGEIRSTHFHAGLDIRTNMTEGLPVYAAAEGYISRISVAVKGYGYALYMTHPNGLTTVYAHLKSFSEPMANWVQKQQYAQKSFEVNLFPDPWQFGFAKGDIIAASGNTGGSSGPHLHFEIRDAHEKILDPLKFHFKELVDKTPPFFRKVAFTTMDAHSRVNGQFGHFEFDLTAKGNHFILPVSLSLEGLIGVEIYAYDRFDGTWSKNGIPCIEMMLDTVKVFSQAITKLSFDEMHNVAVHTNYAEQVTSGLKYIKLWVDDGNQLSLYETNNKNGLLTITDGQPHRLEIRAWDTYNNRSYFISTINAPGPKTTRPIKSLGKLRRDGYEITGNVMELLNSNQGVKQKVVLYTQGQPTELLPSYSLGTNDFYLWDLRRGLPDSVDLCGALTRFHFKAAAVPHYEYTYNSAHMDVTIGQYSLFDTLYLGINEKKIETLREIFTIDNVLNPLRKPVRVTLKPTGHYHKPRSGVYSYSSRGHLGFIGGTWEGDSISFAAKQFGSWTIATDSVPPTIKPLTIGPNECRFVISDGLSGIKNWEGHIDGQWVLINYEYKTKLLWTEKSDPSVPFKGEFELKVTDQAGNETFYTTKL